MTWPARAETAVASSPRARDRRFVGWVTSLVLNVEEHTITWSVVAIERTADWKDLDSFAEYGAWKPGALPSTRTQLIDKKPGRLWHGYRVSGLDDTEVHRSGEHVWGTCAFHEYTARCPQPSYHHAGPRLGCSWGLAQGRR